MNLEQLKKKNQGSTVHLRPVPARFQTMTQTFLSPIDAPGRSTSLIHTRDQPSKGLEDTGTLYPRRFWTASRLFILVALEDNGTLYPRRF
jgi:hypothetical protein